MARLSGSVGLTPYNRPARMVGTAVTVRTRAGDNLAIHRSFEYCRPGDVLVIDGGGEMSQALLGEIMAIVRRKHRRRRPGGRRGDPRRRHTAQRPLPCYARGVTHRGPTKTGPGEINVPVSVGGMVVNPGDVVVGDEDGLLAIGQAEAPAVIALAQAQAAKEADIIRSIQSGTLDRS